MFHGGIIQWLEVGFVLRFGFGTGVDCVRLHEINVSQHMSFLYLFLNWILICV